MENKEILHFTNYFLCYTRRYNENLEFEDYWYTLLKNELHQTIFQVLYRLSLNWDKKDKIKNFEKFIHDNLIWDIPRLFDLCVLYKDGNLEGIRRMCENVLKYKIFKEDLRSILKLIFTSFEEIRKDLFKKSHLILEFRKKKFLSGCIQNLESFLEVMPEFTNFYEPFLIELVLQFERILPFLFNSKILEFQIQFNISQLVNNILTQLYFESIKRNVYVSEVEFIYMLNQYMIDSNDIFHFNFSYLTDIKSINEVFSIVESNIFFYVIYTCYSDVQSFFGKYKIIQEELN